MYKRLKEDIKNAMIAKDNVKKDVLKMVDNKAKLAAKELNPAAATEDITDEIVLQAVRKELKQLNQTKDALKGKEDTDLYKETEQKILTLNEYLPQMMSKEEVMEVVAQILSKGEFANFGQKMGACMKELRGKADSQVIKEVVESFK